MLNTTTTTTTTNKQTIGLCQTIHTVPNEMGRKSLVDILSSRLNAVFGHKLKANMYTVS